MASAPSRSRSTSRHSRLACPGRGPQRASGAPLNRGPSGLTSLASGSRLCETSGMLPNLHLRAVRLSARRISRSPLEAAMNPKQSDSPASLQLSSPRKRDLLDHYETNGDELDRWREFNVAYHEDDRKFMRFLIPPGKRVLELGCGRGDLLAALEPSYGVGVDFSASTIAKANALHPHLHFVFGDAEEPDTLASIEGPFDYIVLADTIGMFEDIDGTLRLVLPLAPPVARCGVCHHLPL